MTREEIRIVVRETVLELRRHGLLRREDDVAYSAIKGRLYDHYKNPGDDPALEAALEHFADDPYIGILEGAFFRRMTTEELASMYGCDPRTIQRQKRTLCLNIWMELRK